MARRSQAVSPERDRRLQMWQNLAMVLMALGVALLIYLAVAHTA